MRTRTARMPAGTVTRCSAADRLPYVGVVVAHGQVAEAVGEFVGVVAAEKVFSDPRYPVQVGPSARDHPRVSPVFRSTCPGGLHSGAQERATNRNRMHARGESECMQGAEEREPVDPASITRPEVVPAPVPLCA